MTISKVITFPELCCDEFFGFRSLGADLFGNWTFGRGVTEQSEHEAPGGSVARLCHLPGGRSSQEKGLLCLGERNVSGEQVVKMFSKCQLETLPSCGQDVTLLRNVLSCQKAAQNPPVKCLRARQGFAKSGRFSTTEPQGAVGNPAPAPIALPNRTSICLSHSASVLNASIAPQSNLT